MKKGFLLISILLFFSLLYTSSFAENQNGYVPRSVQEPTAESYLYALRSNQHTGLIPEEAVVAAYEQATAQAGLKSQTELKWTSLGPDNYGGKTKGILYDNRDESLSTLIAGATGGGIWISINEGITWKPVEGPNLMVSCMVQASNGDIFIGTGDGFEAQTLNILGDLGYTTGFVGQGLWKLSGENTFTQLTTPTANDNTAEWAFINELAINSSGHLFAATNTGLLFSTNGGQSWSTAKDIDGNLLNINATDIQVGTAGVLAAAIENKVYISKSGDPSKFELRSTGEENMLPTADVSRIELAIAPSDNDIIYAAAVTSFGVHQGIYKSSDKGDTWQVILPATNSVNLYNQRGLFNNYIAVFPNDPDRVVVGGANLWEGRKIMDQGLYSWDLKSTSAGSGFSALYVHFGQQCIVFKPGDDNSFFLGTDGGIHQGQANSVIYLFTTNNRNYISSQFYKIAPSGGENRVLAGAHNQGTIFISGEGNSTRQGETIYPVSSGGSCVMSTIHPEAVVVSATQGQMDRSEDMGFTFSTQFLLSTGFGNTQAFQTPIALWESYDDFNSRDSIYFHAKANYQAGQTIKVLSRNYEHPFYYTLPAGTSIQAGDSLLVQDIVASKLFIAVANRVWMTKEMLQFGKTPDWFEISNNTVGLTGVPQSIAYSKDANHLFVGMRNGRLFRISNLALAYDYDHADVKSPACIVATKELVINLPGTTTPISQAITSISVDPTNPNNVMITLANYGNEHYIFTTTNALDPEPLFVSKQGTGLPKMPVYASVLEMNHSGLAYIGTEKGIFTSPNVFSETVSWSFEPGLGDVPVFDLKQQLINRAADTVQLINIDTLVVNYPGTNNYGIIYAATFGRGLYRCNEYRKPVGVEEHAALAQDNFTHLRIYPNPVTDQAVLHFDLKEAGSVQLQIFDLSGKQLIHTDYGFYPTGDQQIRLNTQHLKTGTYVVRLISGKQSAISKIIVY
ncbi:MAG: T9SS type A sorting domain-containing protein [Bacteroidales bacterium]|jgi:photosystem II stability/assembly factor-like uncharacterized protein|nr:T9SS type A sorting domain-containing protein [Bacteroidales bacterium]MDD3700549.1 T9SS type A sorting domain-containing protein [Bacteroidales bacterium]MDY0368327.1 T9SS type A sorting domain-containing protein [Bacteroidales bacterium]